MHWEKASKPDEYCIVGAAEPIFIPNYNCIQLTKTAAITHMHSAESAIVVHFGANIKGAKRWPNHFISIYDPQKDRALSWLQKKFFKYLLKQFSVAADRIFHIAEKQLPLSNLPHYEWAQLAETRAQIAAGQSYILAMIPLESLITCLKAFSQFKKWQQTNMAIVVIMRDQQSVQAATVLLKGYKFKEAVFIYDLENFKMDWMAAAYLTIWSQPQLFYYDMMQWATYWKLPNLIDSKDSLPDSLHAIGEVVDFGETGALSNHFILYYKDELYRQSMANKAHDWLIANNSTFAT